MGRALAVAQRARPRRHPVDGTLRYEEGIHIGYRAWLRSGAEPAYPFGAGLGYMTWRLDDLRAPATATAGTDAEVHVRVTNVGERAGKQVVQVYLARPDTAVDRPVRRLAAFAPVRAAAGEAVELALPLPARAFADWRDGGWRYEPGCFEVRVGTSVEELPLRGSADLVGP